MSAELTARRIEMSVEDAKKLRALMPTKFLPQTGELLFGIRIVPNRTLKDGQFIVDYGEGACQFVDKNNAQEVADQEADEDGADVAELDDPQEYWEQVKADTNIGAELPEQEKYKLFMQAYEQCHSAGYYTTLRQYEDLLEEAILQQKPTDKEGSGWVTCVRGKPIESDANEEFDFEAISEGVKHSIARARDIVASRELCKELKHDGWDYTFFVWPDIDGPVEPILRAGKVAKAMQETGIALIPAPTLTEICNHILEFGKALGAEDIELRHGMVWHATVTLSDGAVSGGTGKTREDAALRLYLSICISIITQANIEALE